MNRFLAARGPTLLLIGATLGLLIGSPVAVLGLVRSGENGHGIDYQAYQWRNEISQTSGTRWRTVAFTGTSSASASPGPRPLSIGTRGPITVTVSATFGGAPVEIRILDGHRVMRPGRAKFNPGVGDGSRSFTFVIGASEERCRNLSVQWRSPTGEKVLLTGRSLVATFKTPAENAGCA